jgi:hypothetical protein
MKTLTWNEARKENVLPKGWLNLSGADLRDANLSGADLCRADLSDADLCRADLRDANLCRADLSGADLGGADLRDADLCGAQGLLSAAEWLKHNFVCTDKGIIVYKRIGATSYNAPENWTIAENSVITEVCNPCRTNACACGVNFGTREWIDNNYKYADIWECLIEWIDLAGVIVPYSTDGKARCERMTLLRKIS